MADKQISQLTAASTVNNDDLLVLQQGGTAKKLTGKKLGDFVYAAAAEKIEEVNEAVAQSAAAVAELVAEKDEIVAVIASMAQLGTDTTLTQTGMAADSKTVGDKLTLLASNITGVEATRTASRNYPVGSLVIFNYNLYKVTSAIASGELITPNTNCTATTLAAELAAIETSLETKAEINGTYEAMTVGNAEQIVATEGVEDSTPYVFRKSGGGGIAIGNREADTLVGGTVAWNQINDNLGTNQTVNGVTFTNNGDGTWSTNGTASDLTRKPLMGISFGVHQLVNHKILIKGCPQGGSSSTYRMAVAYIGEGAMDTGNGVIWNVPDTAYSGTVSIIVNSGVDVSGLKFVPQVFDLTQMLGTTIADYIYSLEQANAGDGVAWFKNLFPNDYYAYNAGELMSVNAVSHVTSGKNLLDTDNLIQRYGYTNLTMAQSGNQIQISGVNTGGRFACFNARVFSGTKYTINCAITGTASVYVAQMDTDDQKWAGYDGTDHPSNLPFTFTALKPWVQVFFDCSTDITITNLQFEEGKIATSYEPYMLHTYPLDSELTIRGIPKLDANNNLYYDGDVYEADGTVTRKYGVIHIGDYTWSISSSNASAIRFGVANISIKNAKNPGSNINNFTVGGWAQGALITGSDTINNAIDIRNSNTLMLNISRTLFDGTAAGFKTWGNGKYIVYELAESIEETADPYASNQVVSGEGTEEYVDAGVQAGTRDVSVPVGHNTVYQQDLRTKLQDAPDSPSEDGDYIMRRINGQNTYNKGNFAETNGDYPNLTAGNAEQLVSTVGIEDKTPYNFRTSGGAVDIGDRETDMVVGGTIAWNQKFKKGTAGTITNGGLTRTINADGSWTVTGTSEGRTAIGSLVVDAGTVIKDHIYYYYHGDLTIHLSWDLTSVQNNGRNNCLSKATASNATTGFQVECMNTGVTYNITFQPQLIDLTQMFGSAVADQIYAMETATAGAGLAFFKSLFPKPYYEYNAGTLMSVNADSHIMTGFNQVHDITYANPTTKYYPVIFGSARLIKGMKYCLSVDTQNSGKTVYLAFYTKTVEGYGNVAFVCNGERKKITFTLTEDVILDNGNILMRASDTDSTGTGLCSNLCINLSWDGERDGEYEPYVEYNYPLDSSLELRGIPKLDSANNLYYDGDTYEDDGTVTRRYVIVDLSTLTWSNQGSGRWRATDFDSNAKATTDYDLKTSNMIASKYINTTWGAIYDRGYVNGICYRDVTGSGDKRLVCSSGDVTPTGFLVYELSTPTIETAEPYQNPQIVDDFGTEEYVDYAESQGTRDVKVPVGHETVYAPNLRAKLEMAPNSPDGDGDYIVRQTNGENEYVSLVIPNELPTAPTTDGNYRLKCTVSSGTATLSWESAT